MSSHEENFAKMSRADLLDFCRRLYARQGIAAFSYPSLKSIPKLYFRLYENKLAQKTLLKELGLELEYKQYTLSQPYQYGGTTRTRWTWEALVDKALAIKVAEGRLPPALWFQKNGHTALIQALYNLGYTWDQLRESVGDFIDSNFVQSRNGLRWLSHAEASLSNFLYARGIEHKKGERYDDSFAEMAHTRYAIYDLHLVGSNRQWFDVEVWGDKPNGHNEERYAKTRQAKEVFNAGNANFIGIHFSDCYDESRLESILKPAIGLIAPFQFDKPTDALIYSTHWSNADELLDYCKDLASKMPNGEFPAEDWLRKRGRWAHREGETFNTLSVYIKQWLGGIRNLRKLIGQATVSTLQWDRASALAAYKKFYELHGLTPQQVRHKKRRQVETEISDELALDAIRISSAVQKYAGGADSANEELGINLERQVKWSKDTLLNAVKAIHVEYGLTPNQLISQHRIGKIVLPTAKLKHAGKVAGAVSRFPGGMPAIYSELGIQKR